VADFARAQRVPLVIEYEDDALTDTGVTMQGRHRTRGQRASERARGEARGVSAVSPELARQIGLENTVVLHGVVGTDLLGIPRPGSPVAPVRVVYTGGISREKGPNLLVAAADLVQRPIEMGVVGTGVDLPALRVQARNVETRVTVHGEVSRARLVEILASVHLAVNPHRMPAQRLGQIFPFKVLDYLGAGLPVVSLALGEHPAALDEAIVTYEGERPDLVAAAIRRAVDDMGPLSAAAGRAREWVANEYSARPQPPRPRLCSFAWPHRPAQASAA
jgi:glycosyltransferase involved in cell wall biosynthesis